MNAAMKIDLLVNEKSHALDVDPNRLFDLQQQSAQQA